MLQIDATVKAYFLCGFLSFTEVFWLYLKKGYCARVDWQTPSIWKDQSNQSNGMKSSGFTYSNSSPSSTMTLRRSFSIFTLSSSSEKLRKCTKNHWFFVFASTTHMKFINTGFPSHQNWKKKEISHWPYWSHLNSQWPNFNFILFFSSQECTLQCMQGRVTLFSQNSWIWSYWFEK